VTYITVCYICVATLLRVIQSFVTYGSMWQRLAILLPVTQHFVTYSINMLTTVHVFFCPLTQYFCSPAIFCSYSSETMLLTYKYNILLQATQYFATYTVNTVYGTIILCFLVQWNNTFCSPAMFLLL
jgi:hypothetical protein